MSKKTILFILGMHRSGTSAMAGAISNYGISGGGEMMPPAFDNERGFFENIEATRLNEAMLQVLGLRWDKPFNCPPDCFQLPELAPFKLAIRNLLTTALQDQQLIFLKDPRLSLLLPVWHQILAELEVKPVHLLMLRSPEEVYLSLQKRDSMDRNSALSLWMNYNLLAERHTREHSRAFVSYNDLLNEPFDTLQSVFDKLDLRSAVENRTEAPRLVSDFVSKKLKHHEAPETPASFAGLPLFQAFCELLENLTTTSDPSGLYPRLDSLWEQYQQNLQFFNPAVRKPLFASFQTGDGQSFSKRPPVKQYIEKGIQQLSFKLENLPQQRVQVRFFPCSEFAQIRLLSLRAEDEDGNFNDMAIAEKRVLVEHGQEFMVDNRSFLGFKLDSLEKPVRLLFKIEYLNVGNQTIKNLGEFSKRMQAWFYEHLQEAEARAEEYEGQVNRLSAKLAESELELNELESKLIYFKSENEEFGTLLDQKVQNITNLLEKISTAEHQLNAQSAQHISLSIELAVCQHDLKQVQNLVAQKEALLEAEKSKVTSLSIESAVLKHELEMARVQDEQKEAAQAAQLANARTLIAEQQSQLAAQKLAMQKIEATMGVIETDLAHERSKAGSMASELSIRNSELEKIRANFQKPQTSADWPEETLRQKDDQIWKLYGQYQQAESDYQQALKTLTELRSSVTFRLGSVMTWPFRAVYGLFSQQPFNSTRLWLFLQFIGEGAGRPSQFLKNINSGNWRILVKALRHEPPRTIAANLHKKLTGGTDNSDSQEPQPESPALPAAIEIETDQPAPYPLPPSIEIQESPKQLTVNGHTFGLPRPRVLFASPFLPDYDTSSGGKRATRMLGLLAEECEVYAFTLGEKPARHIAKLESLGVRVFRENDFEAVRQMLPEVDAIVFSFFYMWFDCGTFLNYYPKAKTIIDSVDVHWVRHERSLGMWEELTEKIVAQKKALEIDVYRQADLVWAVTEEDRQAILAEVPGADVRIVSNVHQPKVTHYEDAGTNRLLFIGGFAHYPNIIAVKHLVRSIFPKIKAQFPKAQLVIAGSKAPPEIQAFGELPGVEFLGFVEDEDIPKLYHETLLALVPLQTGAGIKGKICEAIAFRRPVLTNTIGNEGIGLVNGESGLIAEAEDEIVQLAVRALRREFDFDKMTELAQAKLANLVGPEVVKKNMLESIQPPLVCICIVTWNRMALLKRCIESIEGNTFYPNYKILVHSNGCTDGTQEYLTAAARINPRIVPTLSKTNDVFVIPNNQMMQRFPESDVVLLNNDTYVTPGWLMALHEAAYSDPAIGIAGSKILYPDGRLQEFGSELYGDGTGRNIGKGDDPSKSEYQQTKYSGYVSGCSFYVKRQTIERIGVFDEIFHPCYCEDSDYCYTAWEHGIRTVVTPKSIIFHDEGGTSGTDTSKGFKAYQTVNFEKFLAKHAKNLDDITAEIEQLNSRRTAAIKKELFYNIASK